MKQISEIRHSHASSLQTKHQDHTTGTRIESNSNSSDQDQDQDHQKTIKSVESKDLTPWKAYLRLWSYADRLDVILRSIGVASALGAGTAYPLMTMIFGDLVNEFNGAAVGAISPSEFRSAVNDKTLWFVYLFLGKFGVCMKKPDLTPNKLTWKLVTIHRKLPVLLHSNQNDQENPSHIPQNNPPQTSLLF